MVFLFFYNMECAVFAIDACISLKIHFLFLLPSLRAKVWSYLQEALVLQRFFEDVREMEVWADDLKAKMQAHSVPHSVAEAESLCSAHQGYLAEIRGRNDASSKKQAYGENLIKVQQIKVFTKYYS